MPNDTTIASTVTIQGYTVDLTTLPNASALAMIKRGLSHFLGNEVASRVASKAKSTEGGLSDDEREKMLTAFRDEAYAALLAGTVGNRVSAPRGDTVDGEMHKLARTEIDGILRANDSKFPKGEDTVTLNVPSEDGTVVPRPFTGAELIERRIAQHGDRLRKEAEKNIAARKRKAEGATLSDL